MLKSLPIRPIPDKDKKTIEKAQELPCLKCPYSCTQVNCMEQQHSQPFSNELMAMNAEVFALLSASMQEGKII